MPRAPRLSNNPQIAELQKYFGFPETYKIDPVPNPAKEVTFIKKMVGRGFTWEQIFKCWSEKVDDRHEYVSMAWVNEDIGKGGRIAPAVEPITGELPASNIIINGSIPSETGPEAFDIWSKVLACLQKEFSPSNFRTWLQFTTGAGFIDSTFFVNVPNKFIADYLSKNSNSHLERALAEITGEQFKVNYLVTQAEPEKAASA